MQKNPNLVGCMARSSLHVRGEIERSYYVRGEIERSGSRHIGLSGIAPLVPARHVKGNR